jgi:hypothetical protein
MNAITQVFDAVMDLIAALDLYATPIVGALPPSNGIAAQISTGATDTTFLNKGIEIGLSIVVNAKHPSQQTALDTLNNIHKSLVMRKTYPSTDAYQIVDIRTDSFPNYIGREDNEYLYGSALRVRAYIKNVPTPPDPETNSTTE